MHWEGAMDGLKESLSSSSALDGTSTAELRTPCLALVHRGKKVFGATRALPPSGPAPVAA